MEFLRLLVAWNWDETFNVPGSGSALETDIFQKAAQAKE